MPWGLYRVPAARRIQPAGSGWRDGGRLREVKSDRVESKYRGGGFAQHRNYHGTRDRKRVEKEVKTDGGAGGNEG
jgi:hypothetical protein